MPSKLKIVLRMLCLGVVLWVLLYSDFSLTNNGEKYVPIELNQDVFTYLYNGDEYFEEDKSYPLEDAEWDMIYNSGDILCLKSEAKQANAFYSDDENYDWFVTISGEDVEDERTYPITITEEELSYIYSMEDMEKKKSIFYDEIEIFGSLSKISKDGIIIGITEIAYYDGSWYWRSEIIDESREKYGTWAEYVQKLPDSLNEKIIEYTKW